MEITNQIKAITQDIKAAAFLGDNEEFVSFKGKEAAISTVCRTVFEALEIYDRFEKSPQRHTEILEDLSSALKGLTRQVGRKRSWTQRALACAGLGISQPEIFLRTQITQVEACKKKRSRFFLIHLAQAIWDRCVQLFCKAGLWLYSSSPEYQFQECAFRTVKNLGFLEGIQLDPKLQGAPPTLPYWSVQKDLEQFLKECGPQLQPGQAGEIRELLRQLKFGAEISLDQMAMRISGDFDSQETAEEKLADLGFKIEKQIERLEIGQSLLLPGGYINKDKGGHAVVFEILRMDESNFQFAIYNTGNGSHLGYGLWGIIKMVWNWGGEPIAFQNLKKETVSDQDFLMNILRFLTTRNSPCDSDPMDRLFSIIKKHCVDDHQAEQTRLPRHELQSWGTCTFDSIRSYLKTKLHPDLFTRLEAHSIRKAYEKLNRLLPEIRASHAFDAHSLDLVDRKSKEAIELI